jgi:hypothetical protein
MRSGVRQLDVGLEFAPHLGPRFRRVGSNSGEAFLEDVLRPAFLEYERVVVVLDNVKGWSPSFFEESFGGLAREFGLAEVRKRVGFVSVHRPHLVPMIQSWMEDAANNKP